MGLLNVNGNQIDQFSLHDVRRLQAFADHAAIAIQNSRLYQEVRNYAERLEKMGVGAHWVIFGPGDETHLPDLLGEAGAVERLTLQEGIGAIVVGLGIDYPIHIVERFEEERRVGGLAPREAAETSLAAMGPHILAGMLTTSMGFCAACALLLPLSTSFGLLTGAAVVIVYFTSIFLLPVFLVRIHARSGAAR